MKKTIVIAGGGYAGVLTAKKLERKLRKTDARIVVIDRNSYHTMLTELHEVAAGRVEQSARIIPFSKIFKNRKIEFVQDEIVSADLNYKTVKCKNEDINFDYLVVCTGSTPRFFGIPGAEKYSFKLWSYGKSEFATIWSLTTESLILSNSEYHIEKTVTINKNTLLSIKNYTENEIMNKYDKIIQKILWKSFF